LSRLEPQIWEVLEIIGEETYAGHKQKDGRIIE